MSANDSFYKNNNLILIFVLSFVGCSSAPIKSESTLTVDQTRRWLDEYCSTDFSKPSAEVTGDLVIRSKTKEFKGQFPASVHVNPNGQFQFEVTHLLGGTLARLSGNSSGIDVYSASKAEYSRKGITHYMGLAAPIWVQLIRGDLPCPPASDRKTISIEGSDIVIETSSAPVQVWRFTRTKVDQKEVPLQLTVMPQKLELQVEEWDLNNSYIKKSSTRTPVGEMKWTWRSRECN